MANEEKPQQPVTPEKQKAAPDPTPRKDKSPIEVYIEQTKTRAEIREQMREEMLECPIDAFLAHYSPFLPDDALVDAATQALASKGLLVMDEQGEPKGWEDFDEEPCKSTLETKAFRPLQDIANVFDNTLDPNGRKRKFFYRDCPYDEVKSEIPGCNFKMDASFNGNPDHARYTHVICSETAVVAEFKKSTKDVEDNREQLLSATTHMMNEDPCRMWMYGITIENTEMAIWYFSRSHSVKSTSFDFTKEFRTLIRVFLSFIYAFREEMGYDPTVHRIKGEGEKLQYVYEIPTENGTRYFKTIELIAHQRFLCITGRKTRVWRAVEVNGFKGDAIDEKPNGNREVALKDVWLDDGSRTEKQKLDAIFERLRTIKEESYQWAPLPLQSKLKAAFEDEGYKDYFMEIVCDSFNLGRSKGVSERAIPAPEILEFSRKALISDAGGEEKVTEDPNTLTGASEQATPGALGNSEQAKPAPGNLETSRKGSVDDAGGKEMVIEDRNMLMGSTQTAGFTRTASSKKDIGRLKADLNAQTRSYKVKRQYRLVYKEIGQSLNRVETLETAFNALLDTYVALVLMYLAGWMHRDVSAGNIIAVRRPSGKSGGKLSDLEYAKHCEDDSGSPDPKTGTAFFMPLEIHLGKTYKRAHAKKQSRAFKLARAIKFDPFDPLLPIDKKLLPQTQAKRPQQRQIKFRFQHDLESLWWVALYILLYRVAHFRAEALCEKIFLSTALPSLARQQLFEGEEAVMRALQEYLHPTLRHEFIMEPMDAIADILYDSYFKDEAGPEALDRLYGEVFENLALVVVTIMTEVKDVKLCSTHHVKSQKRAYPAISSKRRDDDEYPGKEEDEEPSSDDAKRRRKKRATASTRPRRR